MLVTAIRMAMARVATPENQVKTCNTGSRPNTAKAMMRMPAVAVCTTEDRCGAKCLAWTRPRKSGRTPALDIECW